mmetsp:Transcript_20287/g.42199  ORF Transcript_20287/g.42199 Transcript_20287/m.42199 type:complete len:100 (-) Transcript_20287:157-456(-)
MSEASSDKLPPDEGAWAYSTLVVRRVLCRCVVCCPEKTGIVTVSTNALCALFFVVRLVGFKRKIVGELKIGISKNDDLLCYDGYSRRRKTFRMRFNASR